MTTLNPYKQIETYLLVQSGDHAPLKHRTDVGTKRVLCWFCLSVHTEFTCLVIDLVKLITVSHCDLFALVHFKADKHLLIFMIHSVRLGVRLGV